MKRVMFVSGHLDTTREEFCTHYIPKLRQSAEQGCAFVVGDAPGTDAMTQVWLADENNLLYAMGKPLLDVTVFHMLNAPRNFLSSEFKLIGGFKSDEERDSGMTYASSDDIAWVRRNKLLTGTGTEKNILRRINNREIARKQEISTWPQVTINEREVWPVYEVSKFREPLDSYPEQVIAAKNAAPRLPQELIDRAVVAARAFYDVQAEIQRLLYEQDYE